MVGSAAIKQGRSANSKGTFFFWPIHKLLDRYRETWQKLRIELGFFYSMVTNNKNDNL